MSEPTVVRTRTITRVAYPLLTVLFAAMFAAGASQGDIAATLVGLVGGLVAGGWSLAAWRGLFVVDEDAARLRTLRGWRHPIRFAELKTASWTRTRTGSSLILVDTASRHLIVSGLDYPSDRVLEAIGPPLDAHRSRFVLDDRIGTLLQALRRS